MRTTDKIQELLASCPAAGRGVHHWLFTTALSLHRHGVEPGQIEELLRAATAHCGRDVSDSEIANAVHNSKAVADGTVPTQAAPQWPTKNAEQVEAIVENGGTLETLRALSPVKLDGEKPHTEGIIDALFPGNPLLCVGPSQKDCFTAPRNQFRGQLCRQQFIVPSPMSAQLGRTKDGRWSVRCLGNTGPRRFLVIEFDQGNLDEQAALLLHLAGFAPLVLVVHSGGKSLHGWFYCGRADESRQEKFMRYAVSLGADHATWTRCQLVRMPDGLRDNGKRQAVQFFNPRVLEVK